MRITSEILHNLEQGSGLISITSHEDLKNIQKLDKAIVYLTVNWSGQELSSRYIVYSILNKLKNEGTPVFIIDCSDQKKKQIKNWLIEQKENRLNFYYDGFGETLLLNKGEIIDFIENPAKY